VAISCDEDELDAATAVLSNAGLIDEQGSPDDVDGEDDERSLVITDRGSAFVEAWLDRVAPLFGSWPPERQDVDDAC
jgi:hypothetical protein